MRGHLPNLRAEFLRGEYSNFIKGGACPETLTTRDPLAHNVHDLPLPLCHPCFARGLWRCGLVSNFGPHYVRMDWDGSLKTASNPETPSAPTWRALVPRQQRTNSPTHWHRKLKCCFLYGWGSCCQQALQTKPLATWPQNTLLREQAQVAIGRSSALQWPQSQPGTPAHPVART